MPQAVQCPGCSKKFKAADQLAGKKVRCPVCKEVLAIPSLDSSTKGETPPAKLKVAAPISPAAASPAAKSPGPSSMPAKPPKKSQADPFFDDDEELRLAPELPPANPMVPALPVVAQLPPQMKRGPAAPASLAAKRASAAVKPQLSAATGQRPRLAYVGFALAFLPLLFLVQDDKGDLESRIEHTLAAHPEALMQIEVKVSGAKPNVSEEELEELSVESIFDALPDGKLDDAHLSRRSWMHWVYAFIVAAVFLAAIRLLFEPGRSTSLQLLLVGISTATFGILLLLMFQWLAELSQGFWLRSGNLVILAVFYVVKFIGWSYHAALDPSNGFMLSMVGFTSGVGLCEEIAKAIPILCATNMERKLDWRGACAWGLASGVGFGVAEGIMYSSQFYNGIFGFDIYLVRFISCVALHESWTGAVAMMIWHNQDKLEQDTWYQWLLQILLLISVPMTLHGLYDTLLKREMKLYALLVAVASFAWLVLMIERARRDDDEFEFSPIQSRN